MKKILITFLVGLFLISFVSAEIQVGTSGDIGVDLNIPTEINYTTVNVNNSIYWGGLETPADISHSLLDNLEWSVAGHTMDTNLDMNGNDIQDIDQAYFGGSVYIHSGDAEHLDLHADYIDLHGNLSTIWEIKLDADGDGAGGDSFGDLVFGGGSDAYIYYNGTDFIIDPDAVGSGRLIVSGDLQADNLIVDGNITGNFIGNSSIWSRAGTNTFLTNVGDNVGIGTSTPNSRLNVVNDDDRTTLEVLDTYKVGIGLGQKPDTTPVKTLDIAGSINIVSVDQPLASFDLTATTGGALTSSSAYGYSVVYVTAEGDTKGAYSGVEYYKVINLGVGENAVQLTNIPVSDDSRVIKRKIYRSTADGDGKKGQLLTTINNNVDTSYLDIKSDGELDSSDSAWYKEDTSVKGLFYNNQQAMYIGWNTVALGTKALNILESGNSNTAVGGEAGISVTSGGSNSLFGNRAGYSLTTGDYNSYIGMYSGYNNREGYGNVFMGYMAGRIASGGSIANNVALGYQSLYNTVSGNHVNTAIGYQSGMGFRSSGNIFLGYRAGYKSAPATIGGSNILIGSYAGDNADTGAESNILIGGSLDLQDPTGSNQLSIGNLIFGTGIDGTGTDISSGNVMIGSATDTGAKLQVNGSGNFTGNVTAENVFLPAYIFAHKNGTTTNPTGGVWHNVTFGDEVSELKEGITHSYDDATNTTFTIQDTGIYRLVYTLNFIDTGASPDGHVVIRVIQNNVEIEGSLFEKGTKKQNSDLGMHKSVLAQLNAGDEIKVQWIADDTTISLDSSFTYGDHKDTAILSIDRLH